MTKAKKLNPSWERGGDKSPFSMPGIEELRQTVKYGLMKKYYGIAQSMWEWTFSDDFEDMQSMDLMSSKSPEKVHSHIDCAMP